MTQPEGSAGPCPKLHPVDDVQCEAGIEHAAFGGLHFYTTHEYVRDATGEIVRAVAVPHHWSTE